jgi:hypothetical protein
MSASTAARVSRNVRGRRSSKEAAVPAVFAADTKLNYDMVPARDQFEVSPHEEKPKPTAEEIAANKVKWGWTG